MDDFEEIALNSVAKAILRNFPRDRWVPAEDYGNEEGSLAGTEMLSNIPKLYLWRMAAKVDQSLIIDAHTQIRYVLEDEQHQVVLVGVESEEIDVACCGPLVFRRTLHLYDASGKEALRIRPVVRKKKSGLCSTAACCCFVTPSRGDVKLEVLAITAQLSGLEKPQVVRIRLRGSCLRPRFEVEVDTHMRACLHMRVRGGGLTCGSVPEWRRHTRFRVEFFNDEDDQSENGDNDPSSVRYQSNPLGTIYFARIRESLVNLDAGASTSLQDQDADEIAGDLRTRSRRFKASERRSESIENESEFGNDKNSETNSGSAPAASRVNLRVAAQSLAKDPLLKECADAAFVIDASSFTAASRSRIRVALLGVAYAIDTKLVRRADSEFD